MITNRITTKRDLIKAVSWRWDSVYSSYPATDPMRHVGEKLALLDKELATEADVANITGNERWTKLTCDECQQDVDNVIALGELSDYESNTASLCKECLNKAYRVMNNI
tara:strand:- start:379 stop:705 length:327 start_codon:yes stop_codon:yes gene_type:complete